MILFCYERDFILSLSDNNQAGVNGAFNSSSKYLHHVQNIDNSCFRHMVSLTYSSELQLNKVNYFDTESLKPGKVFSKFYRRQSEWMVKYNVGLKTLLEQGILEPAFNGELVYKFK